MASIHLSLLRFCRTWTKRYLFPSQTRVKLNAPAGYTIRDGVSRLTCLSLVCEGTKYKSRKDFLGCRPVIASLYLFLFPSLLFLTPCFFSNKKQNSICAVVCGSVHAHDNEKKNSNWPRLRKTNYANPGWLCELALQHAMHSWLTMVISSWDMERFATEDRACAR